MMTSHIFKISPGSNGNGSSPGLAEIGCHAGHWFDHEYDQDHIHDDKDGDQDDQVEVSLKCLKVFYTRSGVDVADKYFLSQDSFGSIQNHFQKKLGDYFRLLVAGQVTKHKQMLELVILKKLRYAILYFFILIDIKWPLTWINDMQSSIK